MGQVAVGVLPFHSFSPDPADEHLADALTDLVIACLGGTPGLMVNSRTSSMCFKHSHLRLRNIAEKLHAGQIIEGSLLQLGGQVQIVAQLIDSKRDAHLWSHTYLRETRNLLFQMNDIARSIAHATCVALSAVEPPGFTRGAPFERGTNRAMCTACLAEVGMPL